MPGPERMRKLGQHKRVRAEVSRLDISTNMRMYLQGHVTWSGDGSGDGWRVARGHYSMCPPQTWRRPRRPRNSNPWK